MAENTAVAHPSWCHLEGTETDVSRFWPPIIRWFYGACASNSFILISQLGGFGIELATWLGASGTAGWVVGAGCGEFSAFVGT